MILLLLLLGLVSCSQRQAPPPPVPIEDPLPRATSHREATLPEHKPEPTPPPSPVPQALDTAIWHLNYAHGVLKEKQDASSP